MRQIAFAGVLSLLLAAVLGVGLGTAQNPPASGRTEVLIKDFEFQPKELRIKVGSTVTFTNKDPVAHSATADEGSFDTGLLEPGQSKAIEFGKVGTFKYHCRPHPSMSATIVVTP